MERRHFNRVSFISKAYILAADKQWQTEIVDLSLKGALLRVPSGSKIQSGDNIQLIFSLDGLEAPITLLGQVSHIDAEQIGLHCTLLDIDSATELRRLIELNLSDESLLQRDLAALITANL
tara:strand:+ start:1113 stop:1475 length:363 start_codon:yes stop_codon:yes gene_type:complete